MIQATTSNEQQGAGDAVAFNVEALSEFNAHQNIEPRDGGIHEGGYIKKDTMHPEAQVPPPVGPSGKIDLVENIMDTTDLSRTSKNHFEYLTSNKESVIVTLPLSPKTPSITQQTIEDMFEFFFSAPRTRDVKDMVYLKSGDVKDITKQVALPPPMYSEFCRKFKIPWKEFMFAKKNIEDFKDAVAECDNIIKEFIISNGLSGNYTTQFAIFTAKNLTDMTDKHEIEEKKVNVNRLLDQIEEMGNGGRKTIKIDSY